jgi:hypothetical protein
MSEIGHQHPPLAGGRAILAASSNIKPNRIAEPSVEATP